MAEASTRISIGHRAAPYPLRHDDERRARPPPDPAGPRPPRRRPCVVAVTTTEPRLVAWERLSGSTGHSMARVAPLPNGWRCHGAEVLAGPGALLSCWFRVDLDPGWVTRAVVVGAVGADGERMLVLSADDERRWDVDGEHRPDLDGCIDVDIAATPLTNTFPLRRLTGLDVGREVTTPIAWVDVPGLDVTRVDQTYRRLPDAGGFAAWEYRDGRYGPFVLTVDEDGLVVTYEGFARRVAAKG
jgi:uncharacterized protein